MALQRHPAIVAFHVRPQGITMWSCAILRVTQGEMLAAISIGQILAVLVTLNLIVLSFAAYRIMRRK